jgi:hypothetical protein
MEYIRENEEYNLSFTIIKRNLFLDLNGTLIYRNQIEQYFPNEKKLKQRYITLRPGTIEFLKQISPYYNLYIYSSMVRSNINDIIKLHLSNINFVGIFDREWNKKDPDGDNEWDTVRDMQKIWTYLKNKGVNDRNSILIENESRKIKEVKSNSILIQSIDPKELRTENRQILEGLSKYLISLTKYKTKDIREILTKNPFDDSNLNNLLIDKNTSLELNYINGKEIGLINFKKGIVVRIKLPLPQDIQIDQKIPYSFLIVNKIEFHISC